MCVTWKRLVFILLAAAISSRAAAQEAPAASSDGLLLEVAIASSLDGQRQSVRYWAPPLAREQPTPLFVFLHSWSSDYRQDCTPWWKEASQRNWIYLQPDFRGPNNRPEACGSPLARQDVLDAIDWASANYKVDRSRIYLAGASGGGHMAMLMAGRHPDRFSAVSAWVGISDLAEWQRFHSQGGKPGRYAEMVVASCGGIPDASATVAEQYRERSPIHWLQNVGDLPLDLAAGVHDGKKGSVPIAHTLRAFNVVATTRGAATVSEVEMEQLQSNARLSLPQTEDQVTDTAYGRNIHLRRSAGSTRVTIFEGGHEGLAAAGCEWLAQQRRTTSTSRAPKSEAAGAQRAP